MEAEVAVSSGFRSIVCRSTLWPVSFEFDASLFLGLLLLRARVFHTSLGDWRPEGNGTLRRVTIRGR